MEIFEFFEKGGFIMIPLGICSIAIWAVVFEKVWGLNKFNKEYQKLFQKAEILIREKKLDEVKGLYASADNLIAGPHLTLIEEAKSDKNLRDEKVYRRLQETQQGLKRFLWILGTISSSAPFIGLFGTVLGIIKSFDAISESGKSGFSVVAAGLSEALFATAAGILVAIISVLFYNYFQVKLSTINLEFKNKLEDLGDLLSQN